MFATTCNITGLKALALGSAYESIAQEFGLPSIETLLGSLKNDVAWPGTARLEVYYLENMIEQSESAIFEMKFPPSEKAKDLVSLFISFGAGQAKKISLSFPGRTGKGSFSRILAIIKSDVLKGMLEFEVEGFPESGFSDFIRERRTSSFVWIEGLQRYLHVKEDPSRVEEVRKGRMSL